MKRHFYLIIGFVLLNCSTSILANGVIDSLEVLSQEEGLTVERKLALQFGIIKALKIKGAKADSLIEDAIELASRNDLALDHAEGKYYRARFRLKKRNYDTSSLTDLLFADSILAKAPSRKALAVQVKRWIGLHSFYNRDFSTGIIKLNDALSYAEENGLQDHYASIRTTLGTLLGLEQRFFEAIEQFKIVLEYPNVSKGTVYWNLTDLYQRLEDYEQVIHYADLAIEAAQAEGHKTAEFLSAFVKAEAFINLERYEEAELLLLKYIPQAKETGGANQTLSPYAQLITIYVATERLDKAVEIEQRVPPPPRTASFAPLGTALGKVYNQLGQPRKSVQYCEESKNLAVKNMPGSAPWVSEACDCLNVAYSALGQFKKAHESLMLYQEAKDILDERESVMNLSRALNQQELSQQEKVLNLEQEKKDAIYQATLSKYKQAGILGLFLLGISLWVAYQFRKRNNKINSQNQMISKALNEKSILLKEIHHRVKNNLQLISSLLGLQSYSIKDPNALQVLKSSKSRVKSMALIHQDLYNREDLTSVSVKEYLDKLSQELIDTFQINENKIKLNSDLSDIMLDVDTLVPLGLIINELITNSFKYAFPDGQNGKINIKLFESTAGLHLEYSDNGIGMDKSKAKESSFGLKLIDTLLDQLEGEMEIKVQEGTQFSFLFQEYRIAA